MRCTSREMAMVIGLALVAAPLSAPAQQAKQKPDTAQSSVPPANLPLTDKRWATLTGWIADSVHNTPLTGATVLLGGTTLSAITQTDGTFRVDSIPPGTYQVAVFHPLLDTLGVAIATAPLRFGADSLRKMELAVPSGESLVRTRCSAAKLRLGPSALIGRVVDADTEQPLDSTRVTLVWREVSVSQTGASAIDKVREAYTDGSGSFTICGIPSTMSGTLQAERGSAKTAELKMVLEDEVLALGALALPQNVSAVGSAELSGRVVTPAGAPVRDARVWVTGSADTATTGDDGEFLLRRLPPGTRVVSARRVGFSLTETAVTLSASSPARVIVRLSPATTTLDEVKIEGRYAGALRKFGFTDRKAVGLGRFITPEDIARKKPPRVSWLFATMPGFRVQTTSNGGTVRATRGNGCVTLWVDGTQASAELSDLDNTIQPHELIGVETYTASSAPSEFKAVTNPSCAVIVLWTNRTLR